MSHKMNFSKKKKVQTLFRRYRMWRLILICASTVRRKLLGKLHGTSFKIGYSVKTVLLPSENEIHSKRIGSFPFRVDLFSEGDWCEGKQTKRNKSCFP